MAQMTSGKVLREARERKGYDLATVARRLRIRPDILRAIEAGDFSAMPPKGYTRNMVNAYARLLGLNPTEIVNMYLDEAYANQVKKARGSSPLSRFDMGRPSRFGHNRSSSERRYDEGDHVSDWSTSSVGQSAMGRVLYDDRTQFSRDDYGVTRERRPREDRSERDFLSHHSGYRSDGFTFMDQDKSLQPRQRSISAGSVLPIQYGNYGRQSRLPSFLQSKLGIAIAIIALLVIVALIVTFVLGRGNAKEDDVSQLPVSGITDTTKTADPDSSDAESAAPVVSIAPTSARVKYSVKSGMECYIETYEGDSFNAEMIYGPKESEVEVTNTWTITTWTPNTIEVTVDGEKVELTANDEYNGMYAYTVDFNKILQQWASEHQTITKRSTTASTSSESSASASASSSASAA